MNESIAELKGTQLYNFLELLDQNLSTKCLVFVEHVSPILKSIKKHFPYYTRHDAHHSFNVIKRMEDIMEADCLKKGSEKCLSKSEAFLLICSAYAHDLGMTVLPNEEQKILNELNIEKEKNWEINPKLQSYLRGTHSERGGEYIATKNEQIGIPLNLVTYLNLLNKSHNLSLNALHSDLGIRLAIDSKEINLLQLASILCVADLLEFSDTRVIDGVVEQLIEDIKQSDDPELKISLIENLKHKGIGSNLAISSTDGKIIINGTFTDPDVLSLTYKTTDYIEKWMRNYSDFDYKAPVKRLKIRGDTISTYFDIPGREFERLGIRMDKQNIIHLITSNSIWINKPEIVIRELLQNSVEACRYRDFYTPKSETYEPNIKVVLSKKDKTITVSDNGCGMSRSTILNNFLTVGNSRSKEPGYVQSNYASLARFGIGFWSVFTIAKKAIIETVEYIPTQNNLPKHKGEKFEVSVDLLKDYTVFEEKSGPPGTKIVLHLKDNINLNELLNKMFGPFGIIACSEIPITFQSENSMIKVPEYPSVPSLEDIYGAKVGYIQKENVQVFKKHFATEDMTIDAFLTFRKTKDTVTFLFSSAESISFGHPNYYSSKCVCGFVVKGGESFPLYEIIGGHVLGYISNKTNPKGFEYTINRQTLLNTPELARFDDFISKQLIETYRSFLKENECHTPKEIVRLYEEQSLRQSHGGVFDEGNVLNRLINEAGDLYCFKLYQIEQNNSLNTCQTECLNVTDLLEKDYRLISPFHFFSIHSGSPRYFEFQNLHYYEICKNIIDQSKSTFFCKRSERDILFNNDPDSYVIFKRIMAEPGKFTYLTFFVCNTKSINPKARKDWILGRVQGIWTGNIVERKIVGSNFAFGNYCFFIQPETKLSQYVRELYKEGKYPEICQLITKLELSLFGHIDSSIKEFL